MHGVNHKNVNLACDSICPLKQLLTDENKKNFKQNGKIVEYADDP